MANSIFSLSAEGYWFASVFCTNMMFCHLGKELISTSPQHLVKQGNLEMSMSVWHQHVLVPTTMYVTQHHEMPSFARTALQDHNALDSCNRVIALHVCLLLHASKEIIAQCQLKNVGVKTLEEVQKWFDLMSEMANSSLFDAAPESLKTKFQELLEDDIPNNEDSIGKQEYPYFCHEILFLRIAHMIFFYCKNNLESGFPNTRYASIQANDVDMKNWEELSGELFQHTFSLDRTSSDIEHYAFLNLPYDKLMVCIEQSDSPSAAHMHVNVLHAIHEVVGQNLSNSLRSDWETEAPILELFMPFRVRRPPPRIFLVLSPGTNYTYGPYTNSFVGLSFFVSIVQFFFSFHKIDIMMIIIFIYVEFMILLIILSHDIILFFNISKKDYHFIIL